MAPDTLHASCLCGAVRWEVSGALPKPAELGEPLAALAMSHCHCGRCRKAHGAPYATFVTGREGQLRITHGSEHTVRFDPRSFCGTCGSVVPDGIAGSGLVIMPAGNFDEDPGGAPTAHIFVGSKAPWFALPDDGLPRFDAYPEALGAPAVDTRPPVDADTGQPRGSCLCGAVAFVITETPFRCRTCHCSRCRKAGSAASLTFLATSYDGVRFTRGEELVARYQVPEARFYGSAFCKVCGSMMPRRDQERGVSLVAMGALDDDPGVRPRSHIYWGSRPAWEAITDGLPQFDENEPA